MVVEKSKKQHSVSEPYAKDIDANDALIHCEISGREDAPVLVLLHGNGEDLYIFEPQIRFFSQHYKVVAIDTRGHGQSTRGTAPLNFHTFATDLVLVLDALCVAKAHIMGFSDGAIIAIHLALFASERISSMVLLGANYHTGGLRLFPWLYIRLIYVWLLVASLFSENARKRKEIWGLMIYQPNLTIGEISKIKVPTLVVTGENDMVSQRHNDKINQAIAGSQRLIIPGGDHFLAFKMPNIFNQYVMEFLQNQ